MMGVAVEDGEGFGVFFGECDFRREKPKVTLEIFSYELCHQIQESCDLRDFGNDVWVLIRALKWD